MTKYSTISSDPRLARGGILADDMGLGKTIQYTSIIVCSNERIISLLVADPRDNEIAPVVISPEATGTLIISPLSLLSNWTSQIEEHLIDSALSVLVFHGTTKSDSNVDLDEYDVVITSYGTLVSDYKAADLEKNLTKKPRKSKRSLFGRVWRRVVLDEGHSIRNPRAKVSLAASRLDAEARWSLTGFLICVAKLM